MQKSICLCSVEPPLAPYAAFGAAPVSTSGCAGHRSSTATPQAMCLWITAGLPVERSPGPCQGSTTASGNRERANASASGFSKTMCCSAHAVRNARMRSRNRCSEGCFWTEPDIGAFSHPQRVQKHPKESLCRVRDQRSVSPWQPDAVYRSLGWSSGVHLDTMRE